MYLRKNPTEAETVNCIVLIPQKFHFLHQQTVLFNNDFYNRIHNKIKIEWIDTLLRIKCSLSVFKIIHFWVDYELVNISITTHESDSCTCTCTVLFVHPLIVIRGRNGIDFKNQLLHQKRFLIDCTN